MGSVLEHGSAESGVGWDGIGRGRWVSRIGGGWDGIGRGRWVSRIGGG